MPLDINAIKNRLNQLSNQGNKKKDIWKPSDEHDIRLLPYKHGDTAFLELHFHYEIGSEPPILCPKMNFNEDCVICDACDQLKSWKQEDGSDKAEVRRKEDWELFRKLQAKPRWFVPMVERDKENEGSQFWSLSKTVYEALLSICCDAENNEDRDDDGGELVLTSPEKAYDLHVSLAKPGEKGNTRKFPLTSVKEKKKTSSLSNSKKEVSKLLDSVKSIWEVYDKMSSEDVEKAFMRFVNGGGLNNDNETTDSNLGQEKYALNSDEAPLVGGLSIDDAFKDLSE